MSKLFYVQPGYEALSQGAWYRPGLLLWIEPGGTVDIFQAPDGKREGRIGTYDYAALSVEAPPAGLRTAKPGGDDMRG